MNARELKTTIQISGNEFVTLELGILTRFAFLEGNTSAYRVAKEYGVSLRFRLWLYEIKCCIRVAFNFDIKFNLYFGS